MGQTSQKGVPLPSSSSSPPFFVSTGGGEGGVGEEEELSSRGFRDCFHSFSFFSSGGVEWYCGTILIFIFGNTRRLYPWSGS